MREDGHTTPPTLTSLARRALGLSLPSPLLGPCVTVATESQPLLHTQTQPRRSQELEVLDDVRAKGEVWRRSAALLAIYLSTDRVLFRFDA